MALEIRERFGHTVAGEVRGTCTRDFRQHCDSSPDHRAILEISNTQHAIDAFAHEIDQPVALAHMQSKIGVLSQEGGQRRQHEVPCQRAVHIYPEQSPRFCVPKRGLRLFDLSENRHASLVVVRGAGTWMRYATLAFTLIPPPAERG